MLDIFAKVLETLEISSVIDGCAVLDDEWWGKDVQSSFSRLYFIKSGYAYVYINDTEIKMTAGNVYLIPAETKFSYKGVSGELCEKRFFHFSVKICDKLDLLSNFSGIYSLPISETKAEEIFECEIRNNYTYLLEIKSLLYKTVVAFLKKYNFTEFIINKYSNFVQLTIDYIRQNPRIDLSLQEVASRCFVSYNSLRKKFKEEVGVSIGKYIDNTVFDKAKHLLVYSDLSIKEIGDSLGFEDRFYFSRRFKEITNKTPLQYRKENKIFVF